MARRPIFIPLMGKQEDQYVQEMELEFKWHPGLSISQKKKNVHSLHEVAKERNLGPVLEVSTKSDDDIGRRLSAFNLVVKTRKHGEISLESAFQGSKVFLGGGPYTDMYGKRGQDIKKDSRLRNSGPLESFYFNGVQWPLEPRTVFYDWIYINAVHGNLYLKNAILNYKGFTDIEYNPKRSLNCQARSCALYVALVKTNKIESALSGTRMFLSMMSQSLVKAPSLVEDTQGSLF